jgi:hypothetical protein
MAVYRRLSRYFRLSRIRKLDVRYPSAYPLPTAALAECTCPDFCERDHDNE